MEQILLSVEVFKTCEKQEYDGKTIVVIGHRATKYGLKYWSGDASIEQIVRTTWEWRDIPIWHYELYAHDLECHTVRE